MGCGLTSQGYCLIRLPLGVTVVLSFVKHQRLLIVQLLGHRDATGSLGVSTFSGPLCRCWYFIRTFLSMAMERDVEVDSVSLMVAGLRPEAGCEMPGEIDGRQMSNCLELAFVVRER